MGAMNRTKAPQSNVNRARSRLPRLAYNLQETAKILGVGDTTIYRLIQRGKLRCCPELRHKVIPLTSIEEFLNPKAE
jgi:excisionase family DNA binding protein